MQFTCSKCGSKLPDRGMVCPHCGAERNKDAELIVGALELIVLVAAALVAAGVALYGYLSQPEKRQAIKDGWGKTKAGVVNGWLRLRAGLSRTAVPCGAEERSRVSARPGSQVSVTGAKAHKVMGDHQADLTDVGQKTTHNQWYRHWAVLTVTTLVFFPVTLLVVWRKGDFSNRARWAWTAACTFMLLAWISSATNPKTDGDGHLASAGPSPNLVRSGGSGEEPPDSLKQTLADLKSSGLAAYRLEGPLSLGSVSVTAYLAFNPEGQLKRVVMTGRPLSNDSAVEIISCDVPGEGSWSFASTGPYATRILLALTIQSGSAPRGAGDTQESILVGWDSSSQAETFEGQQPMFIDHIKTRHRLLLKDPVRGIRSRLEMRYENTSIFNPDKGWSNSSRVMPNLDQMPWIDQKLIPVSR